MSRDHTLDATRTSAIWFMVVCRGALDQWNGYRIPNTDVVYASLRPCQARRSQRFKISKLKEFGSLFPSWSQEEVSSFFEACDISKNKL